MIALDLIKDGIALRYTQMVLLIALFNVETDSFIIHRFQRTMRFVMTGFRMTIKVVQAIVKELCLLGIVQDDQTLLFQYVVQNVEMG